MCELCPKQVWHTSRLSSGAWQVVEGTDGGAPESSANKVCLPQHLMLLPKIPQGCVYNLLQEQLHAHKDSGTASLSHILWVLHAGCLELNDRALSPGSVTGKELGWG